MNLKSYILGMVIGFCMGRLSLGIIDDPAAKHKQEALKSYEESLITYHNKLDAVRISLEEKDDEIRRKWQSMVDDISKYQASMCKDDAGKWTEWDDVYLNSWKSAEK